MNAEFLLHFADGAGVVFFPSIDVTRRGRIPHAGKVVLLQRALLQENFAALDLIELEARQRLGERASDSQVEAEMRRIAAERDVIL